jgi:hypothetical protein
MKKLILLISVTLMSAGVFAQVDTRERDRQEKPDRNLEQQDSSQDNLKDGYIVKDGRMMVVNNGTTSAMKREATLDNGTVVAIDGNYTAKDGKPVMLKDGEHLDLHGVVSKRQNHKRESKDN